MKRSLVLLLVMAVVTALVVAGCASGAASPTPTKASAAAPKAAEPTKAPAQPTKPAAPAEAPTKAPQAAAAKVDFPEKGKTLTMIVPWGAGGQVDLVARVLAGEMEKELGVSIVIDNKPGASGQLGLTDLMRSKPDGYTLAYTYDLFTQFSYLDPEANAPYTRKDFQPLALIQRSSAPWVAQSSSPYQTAKDLVEAAKAKPKQIKFGTTGAMGPMTGHAKRLEDKYGAQLALVNFKDGPTAVNAILGGHVDAISVNTMLVLPHIKDGKLRALGVASKKPNKFLPGVKTLAEQGYELYSYSSFGTAVPAGTPKPIVEILTNSIKKAMSNKEAMSKLEEAGNEMEYLPPEEYAAYWQEMEEQAREIVTLVRGKTRN